MLHYIVQTALVVLILSDQALARSDGTSSPLRLQPQPQPDHPQAHPARTLLDSPIAPPDLDPPEAPAAAPAPPSTPLQEPPSTSPTPAQSPPPAPAPGAPVVPDPSASPSSGPATPAPVSSDSAARSTAQAPVTAVRTPQQLRAAARDGDKDIELRAHLDLRGLTRAVNPAAAARENPKEELDLALLYADKATRSIRGNCSDPDPAAALGLSPEELEAAPLLPLKPRQCLILVDDSFLLSNGGTLWLDNLYLAALQERVHEDFTIVSAGADINHDLLGVEASQIYISNVTMQSRPRRNAKAVVLAEPLSSLLIADSIFSDWQGLNSPLRIGFQSVANVVNTVFRNTRLPVELADVSGGGTVRFRNVSLANVTLTRGAVVSTTANDYDAPFVDFGVYYYAEDDANYDVSVAAVPPENAGLFGAEFVITDDVMSDCLHEIWSDYVTDVQPGCPAASLQQRERVRERSQSGIQVVEYAEDAYEPSGVGDYDYYYVYGPEDAPGPAPGSGDEIVAAPAPVGSSGGGSGGEVDLIGATGQERYELLVLREGAPWIQTARAELPALSTPPSWPPFEILPPPQPANRTSLSPEPHDPLNTPGLALIPPLNISHPPIPPHLPDGADSSETLSSEAIVGVACAAATLLVLLGAAVCVKRRCALRRRGVADARKEASYDTDRVCNSKSLMPLPGSWRTARAELATSTAPSGSVSPSNIDFGLTHDRFMAHHLWTGSHNDTYTGCADDTWQSGPVEICPVGFIPCRLGAPPLPSTQSSDLSDIHAAPDSQCMPDMQPGGAGEVPGAGAGRGARPLLWGRSRVAIGKAPRRPLSGSSTARALPRQEDPAAATASTGRATAGSPVSPAGTLTEPPPAMLCAGDQSSLAAYSEGSTAMGGTVVLSPYGDVLMTRSTDACTSNMHTEASSSSCGHTGGAWRASSGEAEIGMAAVGGTPWLASHRHSAQHDGLTKGHSVDTAKAPPSDIGLSETDFVATNRDVRALVRWLDELKHAHALFLGEYEMLGRDQRRRGGQAVVQFARGHRDRCEYAVKFFLDREAFRDEAALYAAFSPAVDAPHASDATLGSADLNADPNAGRTASTPPSQKTKSPPHDADNAADMHASHACVSPVTQSAAQFLPKVEAVCDAGAGGCMGPSGRPLPPFIVMEKGESLNDWSERAQPDLFASLAVLSNISLRLADMHEAGYVHRDLKPANVMWLPRENRWTVIDFGCAARIGTAAPLSFTLVYAAPEVAAAAIRSEASIESTPALDAWSLGVMAFELMTGAPAFKLLTEGRCRVIAMLRGDLPLPWEGELSAHVQRKLGAFKGPVLQLLHRDPGRRMGMRAFHDTCTSIVASRTTG